MSFSIHFALSNFGAGAGAVAGVALPEAVKIEAGVAVLTEAVDFGELSSTAMGGEDETVETVLEAVSAGLAELAGEEKKEVIDALALGFLAVEVAMSAALRLSGVAMLDVKAEAQSIASKSCGSTVGNRAKRQQQLSSSVT